MISLISGIFPNYLTVIRISSAGATLKTTLLPDEADDGEPFGIRMMKVRKIWRDCIGFSPIIGVLFECFYCTLQSRESFIGKVTV